MLFTLRDGLRKYRFKKILILWFFLIYSLVQCAGNYRTARGEYFPVFGWSLFSHVANRVQTLEMEITRIGGSNLSEPVNYYEFGEFFIEARTRSGKMTKNMRRIYHVYRSNPTEAKTMIKDFERSFLSDNGYVDYQFVVVDFYPLDRWRTGSIIERTVVAQFSTEKDE